MGDVSLGVELVLAIDPTLDFAGADRLDDGCDAVEEVVFLLFGLDAVVEFAGNPRQSFVKRLAGAPRHLVAHQDADAVDLLPLVAQRQQRADLEVAGGDVDGAGELAPVAQVAGGLPVFVAVVDDEQLAAGRALSFWHVRPVRPCVDSCLKFMAGVLCKH